MRWLLLLPVLATLMVPALLLSGCQSPRQSAADAVAGVGALEKTSTHPAAAIIASGVRDYIGASVGNPTTLPRPTMDVGHILEHPEQYAEHARQAKEAASSAAVWGLIGAGVVGLLGFGGGAPLALKLRKIKRAVRLAGEKLGFDARCTLAKTMQDECKDDCGLGGFDHAIPTSAGNQPPANNPG